MTLQEYMEQNFTVIDATSQGMSLQDAIEEVKAVEPFNVDWDRKAFTNSVSVTTSEAIATILNAVVKGELK